MDIVFTITGFAVGGIVGLTGVGGGSLMTPLLLLYGVAPPVAVGTDLLYAALTKCGALWVHHRNGTVQWRIVAALAVGSLPAACLAILLLKHLAASSGAVERVIVGTLSTSLILTSLVLLLRDRLRGVTDLPRWGWLRKFQGSWRSGATVAAGALVGVLVAVSSVGAGALAGALLVLIYPRLSAGRVVGTDIAHAVPLALAAGLGHLQLGTVDVGLLGSLLVGSLPGIYLGSRVGLRLPERVMRPVLGSVLLLIGVGFALRG